MSDTANYQCPLVGREMWEPECYDVQMVHYGYINPNILDFTLDKTAADALCDNCPFNQLQRSAKDALMIQ